MTIPHNKHFDLPYTWWKKYFSSHSVSGVKDPERLPVKPSSVFVFMLSNEGIQLPNAVIQSSTEVKRPVLVIILCSAPALASYSESKLLPMGTADIDNIYHEFLDYDESVLKQNIVL